MDIKKTKEADLESGRATWFLLGLILVLAVIFVVFEYTDHDAEPDETGKNLLDDLPRETDRIPLLLPEKMLKMAEVPVKQAESQDKMKVVDNDAATKQHEKETVRNDGLTDSVASGPVKKDAETQDEQTAALSPVPTDMNDNPLNFRVVEDLPQFPGGAVEFMKWLTRNLRYPLAAERQKIEGKVVVQFVVNRDGSVSDIKVIKPLHAYCDREAMRVMRMMPHWKPGVQNDKPCRTMVCIPIVFKL